MSEEQGYDKQKESITRLSIPIANTEKPTITSTTSETVTTVSNDDVLDCEFGCSPRSDQTIPAKIAEKSIQMAQTFAIPCTIPDVAQYPHLRFDGDGVSDWIEQVARIFDRAGLSDAQRIAEIQYWTKDKTHQKRVEAAIDQLDSWSAGVTALKNTFAIRDPRQLRSAYDSLKELENQPPRSNPSKIYTYCLDHNIRVSETKGTARVPSDLDCTRGLFEGIHSHSLEDILRKAKMTYEGIFKMEYRLAQELVRGWAKTKISLDNHMKRGEGSLFSDQGGRRSPEYFASAVSERATEIWVPTAHTVQEPQQQRAPRFSQPDVDALTEKIRALEIRLNQQPWGYQPPALQNEAQHSNHHHQAQVNAVRAQENTQGTLYDHKTGQYRTHPNRWGSTTGNCFFCATPGHLVSRCTRLKDLNRDGFLRWDPMHRAYFLGGDYERKTTIQVPTSIERKAKGEGKPILKEVCDWVISNNLDPKLKELATYYLRRDYNHASSGPTMGATPPSQNRYQPQPSLARPPTPAAVPSAGVNVNSILGPEGEEFFLEKPVRDYAWEPLARSVDRPVTEILTGSIIEELGDVGETEVALAEKRRGTGLLPRHTKRAKRAFFSEDPEAEHTPGNTSSNSSDQTATDDSSPTESISEPIKPSATERGTTEGTLNSTAVEFWTDKVSENLKTNFKITWEDCCKFCPEFVEGLKRATAAKGATNPKSWDEVVYLAREEAQAPEPPGVNTHNALAQVNVATSDQSSTEAANLGKVTDYIAPLLRIATSVICLSYVYKHKLVMRATKVTIRSFTSSLEERTMFRGVVEALIWLAGRCIKVPLYVIDDELASQPLLLGMNFIIRARMYFAFEHSTIIGNLIFGSTKIVVPLGTVEDSKRALKDVMDIPENGQPVALAALPAF
ncbi:uncharacterized protein BCR38DRAFT_490100 [Pseudomassariella vexata]|uniref:CCHC-type domain-containing protein n=1 Tax=Pseudomassariella vexata TaxID=1141098 RepID=A0A1Y2DEM8_9PEZI|nr:uncharacterized protein BCR38DRAFT_490100 [Pseudomassariella vexata]ORY57586.1 hypothetical protein BCR38DRAFT_490100 [Pseudomassariella vexata]